MLLLLLPWLLLEQRPAALPSAGRRSCEGGEVQAGRSWLHSQNQNHRESVVPVLPPGAARKAASLGASSFGDTLPRLGTDGRRPRTEWSLLAPLLGAPLGDSHHVSCMHTCHPLNTHVTSAHVPTYLPMYLPTYPCTRTYACPCAPTCLSTHIHMPTFQTPRCKVA